jgi:RNA polymerase sigma factor (sigma-70 family)
LGAVVRQVDAVESESTVAASVTVADLFRDNRRRLIGLAAAIVLDRVTAEEIVQDAFEGLQRNRARIENPVGYLQRTVVNRSISVLRRRRLSGRHVLPVSQLASVPEIDEARLAVTRLPARQRAVVAMRFWHDMSVGAIAAAVGWPAGTVKSTLHRALETLKARPPSSG